MRDTKLDACKSIHDIQALAQKRTPEPLFDYIESGTGEEQTLRDNCEAFRRYTIIPRVARDVSNADTSVQFLGCRLTSPIIIAPTGGLGLVYPDAERAAARAASSAGVLFSLSTLSTSSLEEIAKASDGPKIFQLYALTDREFTKDLVKRAKDAGYNALCLTVDIQDTPSRLRATRWGDPYANTTSLRTMFAMARHPIRALSFRQMQKRGLLEIVSRLAAKGSQMAIRNDMTWKDVAEFARIWDGPFLVKGILHRDDAVAAVEAGASAIVLCNHGGNALDSSPATVDLTQEIARSMSPGVDVIQAGGIRRGSDILISLGLGASLVMTGRPFMYGAAAAGEEGIRRAIGILKDEFTSAMKFAGCQSVADLDENIVRRRTPIH